MNLFELLMRMKNLAVWNRDGLMFMPVFDRHWNVERYTTADQAIDIAIDRHSSEY